MRSEEYGLFDLFGAFLKRKKTILLIFFVSVAISYSLTKVMTKKYSASISFVSSRAALGSTGSDRAMDIAALSSMILGGDKLNTGNSFLMEMLQKNRVLDRVIEEAGLVEAYKVTSVGAARKPLRKATVIKEGKGGIFSLTVFDINAEVTQKTAMAYFNSLNETLNEISATDSQRRLKFLEARLSVAQKELHSITSEREYRIKESIYLAILREVEISRANAARDRLAVELIDSAELPQGYSWPNTLIFVTIGAALGVFLIVLYVSLAEIWNYAMSDRRNQEGWQALLKNIRSK